MPRKSHANPTLAVLEFIHSRELALSYLPDFQRDQSPSLLRLLARPYGRPPAMEFWLARADHHHIYRLCCGDNSPLSGSAELGSQCEGCVTELSGIDGDFQYLVKAGGTPKIYSSAFISLISGVASPDLTFLLTIIPAVPVGALPPPRRNKDINKVYSAP